MPVTRSTMKKVGAVLAGVLAFAAIQTASASTLGGVESQTIGANSADVASPITEGVVVHWDDATYSSELSAYAVNGFTLSTVAAGESFPSAADVRVTLLDAGENVIASTEAGTATVGEGDSAQQVVVTLDPTVTAHSIEGISLVVAGAEVTAVSTDLP